MKDYKTREGIFGFIKQCGFKTIIDAQSIRCHSVYFDNKLATNTISEHIKKQTEDILKCFDLFSDEYSKKIYYKNVIAHIGRKYDDCIESYFKKKQKMPNMQLFKFKTNSASRAD